MRLDWDEHVDEILGGDLAVGLAYATPAHGVVITPMAPLGMRDRESATVTLSSSLGLPKKLTRIRANPKVALAYHAREHALHTRPEFVLVQGRASFPRQPDRAWLEGITPAWERFLGPRATGLAGRWLDVYYWNRVPITIEIDRIVVWPRADCSGDPDVIGNPLPANHPPAQKPPGKGTAPRLDSEKLVRQAGRLPHTLLGWIGDDGLPMVIGAKAVSAGAEGVTLASPARELIPPGGRRAGLTSHWFAPRMVGQEQRIHTGWLEASPEALVYAPHTKAGYRLPTSHALFTVGSGVATRTGLRKAREAGLTG